MATANLGRVGFVNKGTYSGATAYKVNDVVVYNSGTYACIQANTGQDPTNTSYWQNWVANDKALDSVVVHKTGNETIAGVKTFNSNTIFNGNVGIGTQSPAAKLDVLAQNNATAETIFRAGIAGVTNGLTITKDTSSGLTLSYTNQTSACLNIDSSGNILSKSPTGGLGYGIGAGGTVAQLTSKSTPVTLNKPSGYILTNNASLAAGATISFTVSNSIISAFDVVIANISGSTSANYSLSIGNGNNGLFTVNLKNISSGALAEALYITFEVIKGATA